MRKRIDEDGLEGHWDEDIPGALLSYNSSVHNTTRVSPYKAVFGHEPLLPCDTEEGGVATMAFNDDEDPTVIRQLLENRDAARSALYKRLVYTTAIMYEKAVIRVDLLPSRAC